MHSLRVAPEDKHSARARGAIQSLRIRYLGKDTSVALSDPASVRAFLEVVAKSVVTGDLQPAAAQAAVAAASAALRLGELEIGVQLAELEARIREREGKR